MNRDYEDGEEENPPRQEDGGITALPSGILKEAETVLGDAAYMVIVSDLGVGTQVHISMPLLYQIEEYMS
ncbi:MAG: hypothetical protein ACLVJO_02240 [[Clostridium] scindens]